MDMDTMDTAHTDMDTMERGLLMLSPMPMPLPALTPRLILGTDTTDTDTGHMDMDTMDTAHTDMDTMERGLLMLSPMPMPLPTAHTFTVHVQFHTGDTMERGLLMLSPMPMPLPALTPRLILGTDTMDTDTGHMDMDTMDPAHTDMLTGVKLKPTTTCCFSLPTLL